MHIFFNVTSSRDEAIVFNTGRAKGRQSLSRKGSIQWLRGHNFALFWPPLTSTWTFVTLEVDKNRDFLDHLPHLFVYVVNECAVNESYCNLHYFSLMHKLGVSYIFCSSVLQEVLFFLMNALMVVTRVPWIFKS